jgi:microcompartment protein CcmL/EutN
VKNYPAIAVLEFGSIADGIYSTDAVLKKAPIAMIKSGTVSGGRYLIILGGSPASVQESMSTATGILDSVFLSDIHHRLHDALLGKRAECRQDSVAILETATISSNVRATELALKGTAVELVEIRIAEYEMSGKAVSVFNGELHEVEAAMKLAGQPHRIIARPHETLTQHLSDGTRFAETKPRALEGEEVS